MDIQQEYEVVKIGKLKEHPSNPKRGDVDAIEESVDVNGWYGAVIAQKSTGFILAGNHRYKVAKKKGAKEIPVIWRDVDDETALRILLADNRTADLGTYDEDVLAELLAGLDSLAGTGFGKVGKALAAVEADLEAEPDLPTPDEVPDDVYTPQYGVMVVCESAEQQEKVHDWIVKNKVRENSAFHGVGTQVVAV